MPWKLATLEFFTDPYAVVHHSTQIFREMAVDIRRDGAERLVQQNLDAGIGGGRETKLASKQCGANT